MGYAAEIRLVACKSELLGLAQVIKLGRSLFSEEANLNYGDNGETEQHYKRTRLPSNDSKRGAICLKKKMSRNTATQQQPLVMCVIRTGWSLSRTLFLV